MKIEEITQFFSPEIMPRGAKAPDMKDKNYLEFVRKLPCAIAGCMFDSVDAHHLIRRKTVQVDYSAIPLSHSIHMELHNIGEKSFEEKYNTDLKIVLISVLVQYLTYKKTKEA